MSPEGLLIFEESSTINFIDNFVYGNGGVIL